MQSILRGVQLVLMYGLFYRLCNLRMWTGSLAALFCIPDLCSLCLRKAARRDLWGWLGSIMNASIMEGRSPKIQKEVLVKHLLEENSIGLEGAEQARIKHCILGEGVQGCWMKFFTKCVSLVIIVPQLLVHQLNIFSHLKCAPINLAIIFLTSVFN